MRWDPWMWCFLSHKSDFRIANVCLSQNHAYLPKLSLSQTTCPLAITPIGHHATQPPWTQPPLSLLELSAIMPISHFLSELATSKPFGLFSIKIWIKLPRNIKTWVWESIKMYSLKLITRASLSGLQDNMTH